MTDAVISESATGAEVVAVPDFEGLAEEWDQLALQTEASTFTRPGWHRAWWSAFGRGELRIFTARRDGRLTAVLPLVRQRGLLRSCSNVHSPVFDGVCLEPGDLRTLLSAALGEGGRGLVLDRLDSEGLLSAAAREVAQQGRDRLAVLETEVSAYVDPGVGLEGFEQSLKSKRSRDLRRRRRRLAEDEGEPSVEILDGKQNFEADLDDFLRLEATGWKVEKGTAVRLHEDTRRFYREMAAWAAEQDLLRLSFLCVKDRRVAVALIVEDRGRRFELKCGYDDEYSRFAPGVLLDLDEIKWAIEAGRTFELGGSMDTIKEELHNAQWTLQQLALFPRSARGTLARWRVQSRQAVYSWARESALLRRGRDALRRLRARG